MLRAVRQSQPDDVLRTVFSDEPIHFFLLFCRTLDNISVNKQLRSLQSIGTKRRIRLLDLDTEVKIMIEVAVDNII